jgi:hypothetical protein
MTTLLTLLGLLVLGRCLQITILGDEPQGAGWRFGERAVIWAVAAFTPASLCLELLARTGSFSPANFLRCVLALALMALVVVLSTGRLRLLTPRLPRPDIQGAGLLLVLVTSVVVSTRGSFDHLAGGRDPGTYHLIGALLSKEGALHVRDPVLGNIPVEARETFFYWKHGEPQKTPGFYIGSDGATMAPRFYPLAPAWSAVMRPLLGERGSGVLPVVWSLGALAALYLAMARWWTPRGALLATVLLAISAPQAYFSRTLTSEMLREWLLFSTLLLLTLRPHDRKMALLAGLAMGLIPVGHLGSLIFAIPVAVLALYRQAQGEGKRELPFFLAFFSLWLWSCLHAPLAFTLRLPLVSASVSLSALDLGLTAVAALLLARLPLARVRKLLSGLPRARAVAAGVIVAVALHAYFLRPHLPAGTLEAAWDRINFPMLGWYLSPVLLLLAIAGVVLWVLGRAKGHALFFSVAVTYTVLLVTRKFIHGDHIWTMRRFLPEVIPCLLGFAVIALEALAGLGRWKKAAAGMVAAFLIAFEAWVALPVVGLREYDGCSSYADELSQLIGPLDVMVMEQSLPSVLIAGALDLVYGRNIVIFKELSRDRSLQLGRVCQSWIDQGRKVFVVSPYARGPRLSDGLALRLHRTVRLDLPYLERNMDRAPRRSESLEATMRVYAVVPWMSSGFPFPADGYVDVGYDDLGLVDGFYEPEVAKGTLDTYRWTGPRASVLVPFYAPVEEVILTLRVAAPRPPSEKDKKVLIEVVLNGRGLGEAAVKGSFTELALIVPGDALTIGYNEVAIQLKEGLGVQTLPTGEQKELGLWVDWVKLQPKAEWKTSVR